jgi:hypothetical protein
MLTRASSTWKTSTSTEPSFGRITSAGHSIVSTTFCSRRSKDSRKNETYPGSRGAAYHNSDRRSDFGGRGGELEGVQQRSMPKKDQPSNAGTSTIGPLQEEELNTYLKLKRFPLPQNFRNLRTCYLKCRPCILAFHPTLHPTKKEHGHRRQQ